MGKKLSFLIIMLFTLNGFSQWTEIANLDFPLKDVFFDTEISGYVVGTNGVYHTTNSGIDWEEISVFDSPTTEAIYENTSFTSVFNLENLWFISGQNTVTTRAVIFKMNTDDLIWSVVFEGETETKINCISGAYDEFTAAGNNGLIVSSDDGEGDIWEVFESDFTNNWKSVIGNFYIGGEDGLVQKSVGTWILINDIDIQDFFKREGVDYLVTDESIYSGETFNIPRNKYIGELNPNCIVYRKLGDLWTYIGTENGIYASTASSPNEWGRFPSTFGYDINQIFTPAVVGFYQSFAICENGAILKSGLWNDYLPYTAFEHESGGCTDSVFTFIITSGESEYYDWYLDDEWVGSDDEELVISIPGPPGYHEIKLTRTNGGTESVAIDIFVAGLPSLSEDISFLDTLMCKVGESEVLISISSGDYQYRLYDATSGIILDEAIGLDGDLFLNTGILYDSALFVLSATDVLGECVAFFPDTFQIIIDNPIANFKAIPLNANVDEEVYFKNHSLNASLFEWHFLDADAEFTEAMVTNPTNKYSTIGFKSIELIASTENECSDTTVLSNLICYSENDLSDFCWAHHLTREDWGDNVGVGNRASSLEIDEDNQVYVSTQSTYNHFPTKAGQDYTIGEDEDIDNHPHVSFAKYSSNGVLKWTGDLFNISAIGQSSIDIDHNKNVILAAGLYRSVDIIAPNGDTIIIPEFHEYVDAEEGGYFRGLLMKLDSNGNVLWYSLFADKLYSSAGFMEACVDGLGNVYSLSSYDLFGEDFTNLVTYVFDDQTYEYFAPTPYSSKGSIITKWSPEGEILWKIPIHATDFSFPDDDGKIYHLTCSGDGTLYLKGMTDDELTLDTPLGAVDISTASGDEEDEFEAIIIALNSSGQYLWHNSIWGYDEETDEKLMVEINHLKCNPLNNELLVTGKFPDSHNKHMAVFESHDPLDSEELFQRGQFLAKYDQLGNLEWVNTSENEDTDVTMESIAFDADNNIYLSGELDGVVVDEEISFNSTNGSSMSIIVPGRAIYVNKYSNEGDGIASFFHFGDNPWALINTFNSSCTDLEIDSFGNIFGFYTFLEGSADSCIFADDNLPTHIQGSLLAKFDSTGCFGPYASIDQFSELQKLIIYPNPSNETVNIKVNSDVIGQKLEVIDFTGKIIDSIIISAENQVFDVSEYTNGIYILKILNETTISPVKLVVSH